MANQQNTVQDQVNLVGEGTVFEGTLQAEHDVRASGTIIGTLRIDGKVMVAESGSVEGEVFAANADVAGHVQGELHVEERLVLRSSARVEGTLETDRLVVEEGAQFTGECEMDARVSSDASSSVKENVGRTGLSDGEDDEESVQEAAGASSANDGGAA